MFGILYDIVTAILSDFLGLDQIIGGLLNKLRKDLDVDEAITAEAEKAFFTLNQGQSFGMCFALSFRFGCYVILA